MDETDRLIDGFQSPLGMEALATIDWLLEREHADPSVAGIREALNHWTDDQAVAQRKQKLFDDRLIKAVIDRLRSHQEAS